MQEAQNLFWAGSCLWLVMVEVDNALARSDEMLLGVCTCTCCVSAVRLTDLLLQSVLLIPYGLLSATEPVKRVTTLMLSGSLTVKSKVPSLFVQSS
jgi:hypothetical protein